MDGCGDENCAPRLGPHRGHNSSRSRAAKETEMWLGTGVFISLLDRNFGREMESERDERHNLAWEPTIVLRSIENIANSVWPCVLGCHFSVTTDWGFIMWERALR